jgi:hypothetical protein
VSQGAISRFESGRGLSTPFLVVLRIRLGLTRALRQAGRGQVSDDVERVLREMELLAPDDADQPRLPAGVPLRPLKATRDAEDERLIRLYRRLAAPKRRTLLALVEAAAKALAE